MSEAVLPTGKGFSQTSVAQGFSWRGEFPHAWGRTRFLVPKGWHLLGTGPAQSEPDTAQFVTLGRFAPGDLDAVIEIRALRLVHEVTAELLLRHYLILSGTTPVVVKVLSDLFADSLSERNGPQGRYRSRIAIRINGDLAFILSASCSNPHYESLGEAFGLFIASFSPEVPATIPGVEPRIRANVSDVVAFEYPSSWRARVVPSIDGKAATDLVGTNLGVPTGLIRVKVCSKNLPTRLELQVEDALQEFGEAGVSTQTLVVNTPVEATGSRFRSGFLHVYEASTSKDLPQELWIVCLEDADWFVTISMLSPDRRDEFLVWAWNRTALDIVTRSLT